MRTLTQCLLFVLISSAAVARTVTVGHLAALAEPGIRTVGTVSYIDLQHPATDFGSLTRALVRWEGQPDIACAAAYKLVFVRPLRQTVGKYLVLEERGPFTGFSGSNEIELTPPIPVSPGDLIGITQLQPSTVCGRVWLGNTKGSMFAITGDIAQGADTGSVFPSRTPGILASTDASLVVGVIPVAGAGPGSHGSLFRTSLQLTNLNRTTGLAGTIVFHPAGRAAAASDPSMPFRMNHFAQTISFPDIVSAMGQTGLGSIDIVTSGVPPLVTARVYNQGTGGSSGFVQDAIDPFAAPLLGNPFAVLHAPSDPASHRMNIGVRTLDGSPADLTLIVNVYSPSGELLLHNGTSGLEGFHTYPANYFEQTTAEAFTGMDSLPPDALILIVNRGPVIIYGTITDNRTNASTIQFATPQ